MKRKDNKVHEAVLKKEVLEAFGISAPLNKRTLIIDATLGTGGHSIEFLKKKAMVLGIDADEEMIAIARKRIKEACPVFDENQTPYLIASGNFRNIEKIAKENNFKEVDGILFDLGVSNLHFKDLKRGFSFKRENAILDMRLNPTLQKVRAFDLLNFLSKSQLVNLFEKTMDGNLARRLSLKVIDLRKDKPFETVGDLLSVIEKLPFKKRKIHPATKAMLALRMAVNSELENLKEAIPCAFGLLKKGGRLAIISFHSGEDKIVKDYFNLLVKQKKAKKVTKKPITPKDVEIENNLKARSAKLRVIEKK